MADYGDKAQVGILLSPEALVLADALAEHRSGPRGPKWTRSVLIEELIYEEAKNVGVKADAKKVKARADQVRASVSAAEKKKASGAKKSR